MPSAERSPGAAAERIAAEVLRRPASLGGTRLLAIDGRSGSGKSTLARAVTPHLPGAFLLEVERLYPGWSGLAEGVRRLAEALTPLAVPSQRVTTAPTWDWLADAPGEPLEIPRVPVLVVEGVGAGTRALAPLRTALVWVTASDALRRRRALARDGDRFAPHWAEWARQEERHFSVDPTDAVADLVVADGTILER